MNYRHTYLASYALKLLYGNLGSKKFSGKTPESPFKVHPQPKILATPMVPHYINEDSISAREESL
jgi:hypothetical protein